MSLRVQLWDSQSKVRICSSETQGVGDIGVFTQGVGYRSIYSRSSSRSGISNSSSQRNYRVELDLPIGESLINAYGVESAYSPYSGLRLLYLFEL